METSRRQFFGMLGAALAGATLDPERLLWRPGAKTIFLPPKPALVAPVALRVGDLFSIEGVYAVNPINYTVTDHWQRFVVTADVQAGESVDRVMWPRPIDEGAYQNAGRVPLAADQFYVYDWPNHNGRPVGRA